MEIAADEAKLALIAVGENLNGRKKLGQSRAIKNRLQKDMDENTGRRNRGTNY